MVRSCNIAFYFRSFIYCNIKDVLFEQKAVAWNDDVGRWVEKSFAGHLDSAADGTTPKLSQGRKQIVRQLRTQYVEGIHRPKYYTVTLKSRLRVTQGHWKRNLVLVELFDVIMTSKCGLEVTQDHWK